jgi:hypothetical protein
MSPDLAYADVDDLADLLNPQRYIPGNADMKPDDFPDRR